MKRVFAMLLATAMLAVALCSCTTVVYDDDGDIKYPGAVIDIYLGTKPSNLDPAVAYTDENAVKILSLIFQGLTKINSKGKLEKALAKKWVKSVNADGYTTLTVTLKDTYWSDGTKVQANDIVYAWKRILDPEFQSTAASLLYAIYGAKDAKLGKIGIDDIGLCALGSTKFQIVFEPGADVDEFLFNTASIALVPLRENKVDPYKTTWSYSSRDLSTNGPFRLKKFTGTTSTGAADSKTQIVLERSKYYYLKQDVHTEAPDKYVTPYRVVIHFEEALDYNVVSSSSLDDDIFTKFQNEKIYYVSTLTPETASAYGKSAKTQKLASTYSYYFNLKNAALANTAVRQALSAALDRKYAASLVAGADAATGLIPKMVFETDSGSFRKKGGDVIGTTGYDAAMDILDAAGVKPSSFSELYLYYLTDEVNDSYASASLGFYSKEKALATYAKQAWEELGFKVVLKGCSSIEYEQCMKDGSFDIIGLDYQMLSAYALYALAPFATSFSGNVDITSVTTDEEGNEYYTALPHITVYNSAEYDELIETAWATENKKERAQLLHDAEKLLISDAPIVPVVFNGETYVVSGVLSGLTTDYFGSKSFTKAKLKNYTKYLETQE